MDLDYCLKQCDRISNSIKENRQLYDTYLLDYDKRISSVQYSKGGRDLHRGYFCPSKIFDIICNVSRGYVTAENDYDFMYGFDNDGQLIFARRSKQREFIKKDNDFEIGITYSTRNRIEAISECFYEKGKIKQYFYYLCDSPKNRVKEMTAEIYDYMDNMFVVKRTKFLNKNPEFKSRYILTKETYNFKLENNQIVEYDVTQNYPISFPTIAYKVSNNL